MKPTYSLTRSVICRLFFASPILLAICVISSTVQGAVLTFSTAAGTLVAQIEDPGVSVNFDGEELRITGAGQGEVRMKVGPYLFRGPAPDGMRGGEVLSLRKDDRVVVRVLANPRMRAEAIETNERDNSTAIRQLRAVIQRKAGELVQIRSSLDERVWPQVKSRYTTTEAAKLLILFFRGDGRLPSNEQSLDGMPQLQSDLAKLRRGRVEVVAMLSEIARLEKEHATTPLAGTWEVNRVSGAGGVAADALELYDPDPVGRKFVATNDSAGLLTGGAFWLFDTNYPEKNDRGSRGAIDLKVVVRGNTIYRGLYAVEGDTAKLAVSPMNSPRPASVDREPTDGGFVLSLKRTAPR